MLHMFTCWAVFKATWSWHCCAKSEGEKEPRQARPGRAQDCGTHLVALKGSNPVSAGSVSQHWLAIFAGAGEKVSIWCDRTATESEAGSAGAIEAGCYCSCQPNTWCMAYDTHLNESSTMGLVCPWQTKGD